MPNAKDLVRQLELQPHPEGGWYRETWRGAAGADGRAIGTAILFLLEAHQRSHWHRVDADELWIWQLGDPLALLTAENDDSTIKRSILGGNVASGQMLQSVVSKMAWQAAEPLEGERYGFTLVSCVVTPGFQFDGFELAASGWSPG